MEFVFLFFIRIYIACLIRPLVYTIFAGAFILGAGGGGKKYYQEYIMEESVLTSV